MNQGFTISWILVAIALASKNGPCSLKEIMDSADYINHLVPTKIELDLAVSWLEKNDLIKGKCDSFKLTSRGEAEYESALNNGKNLSEIIQNMELIVKNNYA